MRIKFVIGVFDLICSAAACAVPAQVAAPNAQPVVPGAPKQGTLIKATATESAEVEVSTPEAQQKKLAGEPKNL